MFKVSVPKILRTCLAVLLMFVFALGASMQESMASGAYAPLEELLAAPFRATVIRHLA